MTPIIDLKSPNLKYTGVRMHNPHRIKIYSGVTTVIGANGAGKSTLASILEGGWNFLDNDIQALTPGRPVIRTLAFNDIHSLVGFKVEYYQQRYESTMNDDVPRIADLLGHRAHDERWLRLAQMLHLHDALDKRANYLSSGELRKFLISNALLDLPDVLVLDNPYIGLDAPSRAVVDEALSNIAKGGTSLMLLVSDPADIPPYTDTLQPIEQLTLLPPVDVREYDIDKLRAMAAAMIDRTWDYDGVRRMIDGQYPEIDRRDPRPIVEMHQCRVGYGSRVLIDNVDWTVNQGECWALSGPNGSGKSTLLSLINADNPQAYANDIRLFGRRRGTGESIWDIKDHIGFLSSELHLFFNTRLDTVRQVVAGGLSSFARATTADTMLGEGVIERWMQLFGIDHLADRPFRQISYGEQSLTLFVRAIIKRPRLLILDEPMHGVDAAAKRLIGHAVDAIAARGTSVIFVTHCVDELPRSVTLRKSTVG